MEKLIKTIQRLLDIGNSYNAVSIDVSSNDFESNGKQFNFRVGTGGTVRVDYKDSSTSVDLVNCADGSYHPNPVTKIHSTGTTASNIVIYYI